jgi:hypothetical protein
MEHGSLNRRYGQVIVERQLVSMLELHGAGVSLQVMSAATRISERSGREAASSHIEQARIRADMARCGKQK